MNMGYALAGTVQAVGSEVKEWEVGDRVMVHAPHGDWALCNVGTAIIRRLPAGVSMEEGALARMGGISLVGVRQGNVTLGETVVVLGLGLVGQFAAQLCRLAGARPVIGVDLFPNRVQIAAASGIYAINPDEADVASVVREMTSGRMAEVVIEATGNPQVMPIALDLAAEGGRVVLLGSLRGNIEMDAYSTVHRKGISLIGAHDRLSAHAGTFRDPWTRERNLDLTLTLFADGSLKGDGLISHRIQPDDIRETYEMLIKRPRDFLGVLIEWDKDQR
jgi:threonine dehydrogenase-like Zn-dependent dehydrogenase